MLELCHRRAKHNKNELMNFKMYQHSSMLWSIPVNDTRLTNSQDLSIKNCLHSI